MLLNWSTLYFLYYSVTILVSILLNYKQSNSNALQNHLDQIYKTYLECKKKITHHSWKIEQLLWWVTNFIELQQISNYSFRSLSITWLSHKAGAINSFRGIFEFISSRLLFERKEQCKHRARQTNSKLPK